MPLKLVDLVPETRTHMLEEIERDIGDGELYLSQRLDDEGRNKYPDLLKESVTSHDDEWLSSQIRQNGLLKATEQKKGRGGVGMTTARVPVTAAETLAQGEFNRFYIRGLCVRAIAEGKKLEVYRARLSSNPRPESEAMIGTIVAPEKLLYDLRINIGVDTVLGLPAGPNSGLSVKLA